MKHRKTEVQSFLRLCTSVSFVELTDGLIRVNPWNPCRIFNQTFTLLQRVPALGAQFELLIVAADEHQTELGARDVADKLHVV